MLHSKLLNPESIAVIGGSDHLDHIGGSVLKNLLDRKFKGKLYVVIPKKETVQGIRSYHKAADLPQTDLAIFAIPAGDTLPVIRELIQNKGTRGFIIFAAGFSELNSQGAQIEHEIARVVSSAGGSLLGPNNIGMINQHYAGIFTRPLPVMDKKGVDFISGSGATAVFTIEAAQQIGLTFSNVFSVGNSAQIGVEEVLEHLDSTFDPSESSRVIMLYIESVKNASKLLRHSLSLKQKGCSIVALKSGVTEKGNRAAASHTGAMVNPDQFVKALFAKAGIIRCRSRYELIYTAGILRIHAKPQKKFAIITHAGGPGVILTDTLSQNGLEIPDLDPRQRKVLTEMLYPGASTANPIDILATGTADQLGRVMDYCEHQIPEIDGVIVIFGSPGLGSVTEAYEVISDKISKHKKPVYPIFPSVVNVREDISCFIQKGNLAFYDEFLLGLCLSKVSTQKELPGVSPEATYGNRSKIRSIIDQAAEGFVDPLTAFELLKAASVPTVRQVTVNSALELFKAASDFRFPVVMKIIGPLHKTDSGGVITNVMDMEELQLNFKKLMQIEGAEGVLVQEMIEGNEVFIGAKSAPGFPPLLLCGAGGIYVEALADIRSSLVPVSREEAVDMVGQLHITRILKGMRGQPSCDIEGFYESIVKISSLLSMAPEISELDINPLIINRDGIQAVDVRIRVSR